MRARGLLVAVVVTVLVGCTAKKPIEQRTTQGPTAQELWAWRMTSQVGREPSFDERRYFDNDLESRIGRYLSNHPEDASALQVSVFRFDRRVSVGMSREQVVILLGPPVAEASDAAGMARQARKFWADIEPRARTAWTYPLGWTVYFGDDTRVVDITQFHTPGHGDGS